MSTEAKKLAKEVAELKRQIESENQMLKTYDDSVSKTKSSYLVPGQVPSAGLLEREKIRIQIRENSTAMRLSVQSSMSQHLQKLRTVEQKLVALKKAP
ncbi:hypothetical protein EC968_002289 [Mortierella alpina]|nr:hypothetical protein EC968_002289 [Mortierella alpina]